MKTAEIEQQLQALCRAACAQTVAVTLSVPGLDYTVRLVFDGGGSAAYQHREFAEALGAAYDAQVGERPPSPLLAGGEGGGGLSPAGMAAFSGGEMEPPVPVLGAPEEAGEGGGEADSAGVAATSASVERVRVLPGENAT